MRLIDWLDRGAMLGGADRACVIDGTRRLGYGEVVRETRRIGAALLHHGAGPGTTASVLGPNSADALTGVLAIARSGAAWIPANARATVDELVHVLTAGSCRALIYDPEMAGTAALLRDRVPSLRWTVSYEQLRGALPGDPDGIPDPPERPDETAMVAFTGGTTGRPKGVVLSNRAMESMVTALLSAADLGDPPVYLAAAPLTHAAGAMCFPALALGGTVVVQRGVEAGAVLEAIERHRVTFLFLPPTAVYMLLADPSVGSRDRSSLRTLLYAAAPMAPERVREALEVFGPVLVQTYGQTEAPMICTVLTAAEHAAALAAGDLGRLGSCGRPSAVARVAVMDDAGTLLGPGATGEIVVRGSLLMDGYLDAPEATAAAFADGWLRTGDVGYLDESGYTHLVDRKKDMIISGGFNVYSAEVEHAVLAHPSVQQCAVIGTPHARWGEAVTAVVELRPGASLDADELIAACKASLGSIKAPKRVEVWDELPRSAAGKILKREIRAGFWSGLDRAI
ncbi:AMP-binding protein [Actinomadura sp. B10D3]|uniref:AMP-binding protein n=1 Tax=Actinomadura sp. B10D3 TaxID=3153557 RepID=UPI00325E8785